MTAFVFVRDVGLSRMKLLMQQTVASNCHKLPRFDPAKIHVVDIKLRDNLKIN